MRTALLAVILAAAATFNLLAIGYGQPKHYDQAVDGLHPLFALDAVDHVFGERSLVGIKYPRMHYLATGAAERLWLIARHGLDGAAEINRRLLDKLALSETMDQVAFRAALRAEAPVIGELIVVGRCVAALLGVALVLALFLFTREVTGDSVAALIAAALTAVSYPIVYYSHTLNVDVPYMAYGMFGLFFVARAIRTTSTRALVAAALFAALAVATKDQAYGWFLVPIPLWIFLMARPGELGAVGPRRPFPWKALAITFPAGVLFYLLAFGWPFDMRALHAHFDHIFGAGVDPYREFEDTATGQWKLLQQACQHLHDAMGPVLVLLAGTGAVLLAARSWRRAALLLLPALSYYATFIAPIGYCYLRFTMPILVLLLAAVGVLLARLFAGGVALRALATVAFGCVLFTSVRDSWGVIAMLRGEPWTPATRWLEENIPAGARLVAYLPLPVHNIEPPPQSTNHVMRTIGDRLPASFGTPDWVVVSFFDKPRTVLEDAPPRLGLIPEMRQFGHHYVLVAHFEPVIEHPLRRGVAFEPNVLIFRRDAGG